MKSEMHVLNAKRRVSRLFLQVLICGALAGVTSCSKESESGGSASGGGAGTTADAKEAKEPVEAPLGHVTNPAEAAQRLDFTTFPLMEGASDTRDRTLASLNYRVTADVKTAYEFQKKHLAALKWKEQPQASVTEQYASGVFACAGFHASVSVMPSSDAGKVDVMMVQHGNVDLSKLPRPAGTKEVYAGPISAIYSTETALPATLEESRKLLLAAGWEPYGSAGDSLWYKQNAVQLNATINSPPAQGGKTMISYSTVLMSAEIPAPADGEDVRYTDTQKRLTFNSTQDKNAIAAFYKAALAKMGWKANREELIFTDDKDLMVFRNPGKDMIWMEIKKTFDNKLGVVLEFQTAAELAAMNAKLDAQAAAYKKKMEAEKDKPAPKVSMTLPAGASGVSPTKSGVKFTTGNGQAKGVIESLRKQLVDAGWKENAATLDTLAGAVSLTKDDQTISINYTDTGILPVEAEITLIGAQLEVK